ncbi:hypothetical protein Cni_G22185 [Canna indica]|uniref:Uncharacterized protein n=1 Tax=Canna indica TaxID=4628 RepID=A0AAQ3KS87_9LILI|nr:hypothetical protein Cni_G22185 [Canna indica]
MVGIHSFPPGRFSTASSFSSLRHSKNFALKPHVAASSQSFIAIALLHGVNRALCGEDRNSAPLCVLNGGPDLTLLSCIFTITVATSSIDTGDSGGEEPPDGGDMGGNTKVDVDDEDIIVPPLPNDVGLRGRMIRS